MHTIAEAEVALAAVFEQYGVLLRHDHLRSGYALKLRHPGYVIDVAVRGEQQLRIGKLESKLLDSLP